MRSAEEMESRLLHLASHAKAWNWLCIAAVLVNATLENILVPALPQIRASLSLSAGEAAWLFSILLITAAVSLPTTGRLGDAYGPRWLIVGVLAVVNLGVACAAVAQSYPLLLLGLALQGPMLCLVPLALSLQREIRSASEDENVTSAGLIAAASASTLVGMLLATIVLERFSFRILFWATLGLDLPLLAGALLLIRNHSALKRPSARIDWLGALLLGCGLFGLLTGISLSETSYAEALAVASGALILLGAALRRFRVAREPLIELDLLFAPRIAYAALIQFGAGFGTFGMFVILPMIISSAPEKGGFGLGGSTVSLCLLPFGVTGLVSPAAIPLLRGRLSSGTILLLGSISLLLAPLAALESSLPSFAIGAGLLGVGIGITVTQTFDLIGMGLPADRVATFSALAYVLRMVGNAFGGLVIGVIAGSALTNAFSWGLAAAAFAMLIPLLASIALIGQGRRVSDPSTA